MPNSAGGTVVLYDVPHDELTVVSRRGKTRDQRVCTRFDLVLDAQDHVVGIKVYHFSEVFRRFRDEKKVLANASFLLVDFLEFLKLEGSRVGDDCPTYQGSPRQLDFLINLFVGVYCGPVRVSPRPTARPCLT